MSKNKIIKEARGIAESAIPYTHAVLNEIDKEIRFYFDRIFGSPDYLESVKHIRRNGYLPMPDHAETIVIPYRTLAKHIDDDIFEDFPVIKLNIDVKFAYVDNGSSDTETEDNLTGDSVTDKFGVGGGAWPIFKGNLGDNSVLSQIVKPEGYPISKKRRESIDRAIIGELDFDFNFYTGFNPETDYEDFHREVRAVVFHEMMHLYENYKDKKSQMSLIHKSGAKSNKPKTNQTASKAYLADTKLIGVPQEITTLMGYLYQMYYVSLPTEVKAITHEMYPYVLDMDIDDFFKTYQGKRIRTLMEFDAEDFYDQLKSAAEIYFEEKGIKSNKQMRDGFFEQIRMRTIKKYKTSAIQNHEELDVKLLNKRELYFLIEYMGKQIEKAGNKLFRNVGKLYSLKAEINEKN
jgi:hypothetical protein